MKTLKMLGLVLVMVLSVGAFTWMNTGTTTSPEEGGHKVAICHFGGHDGDYVTTGRGCVCLERGGDVLIVARQACEKGHDANGNCNLNNLGWLDPDS